MVVKWEGDGRSAGFSAKTLYTLQEDDLGFLRFYIRGRALNMI